MFRPCLVCLALLLASRALAQTSVELAEGQLVIGWISASSFHFCRAWGDQKCAPRAPAVRADVKVETEETASQVRLTTEYVVVEIERRDGRLRVLDNKGKDLMSETEAVAPSRAGGRGWSGPRAQPRSRARKARTPTRPSPAHIRTPRPLARSYLRSRAQPHRGC